jgi:hypothetical protein
MNRLVLTAVILLTMIAPGYAKDNSDYWTIESYHYGLSGKDCSRIYNTSSSSKWSFTTDPAVKERLYKKCKDGEQDLLRGKRELPQVLEKVKNQDKKH